MTDMADYGNEGGWRRSAWGLHSGPDGRHRVPNTGDFHQFDLVEIDPDTPGYIKKAAANTPLIPGVRGILIQEDGFLELNDTSFVPSHAKSKVKNGNLCAIWTGAGLVMWLKNTADLTHPNGAVSPGREVLDGTFEIQGHLAWDGDKWVPGTDEATSVGVITQTDGSDYVEAVLAR